MIFKNLTPVNLLEEIKLNFIQNLFLKCLRASLIQNVSIIIHILLIWS